MGSPQRSIIIMSLKTGMVCAALLVLVVLARQGKALPSEYPEYLDDPDFLDSLDLIVKPRMARSAEPQLWDMAQAPLEADDDDNNASSQLISKQKSETLKKKAKLRKVLLEILNEGGEEDRSGPGGFKKDQLLKELRWTNDDLFWALVLQAIII